MQLADLCYSPSKNLPRIVELSTDIPSQRLLKQTLLIMLNIHSSSDLEHFQHLTGTYRLEWKEKVVDLTPRSVSWLNNLLSVVHDHTRTTGITQALVRVFKSSFIELESFTHQFDDDERGKLEASEFWRRFFNEVAKM